MKTDEVMAILKSENFSAGRGQSCAEEGRKSSAPAEKSTFFKTAVTLSIFILFEPGFFHYPRDTLSFLNCPRTAKLDEN